MGCNHPQENKGKALGTILVQGLFHCATDSKGSLLSGVDDRSLCVIEEKRPDICLFIDDLGRRLSGAVSCTGLNPDQGGVVAGLACLEHGGIFE